MAEVDSSRWNIEEVDGVLRICRGEHHRSEACQFVEYVPRPVPPPRATRRFYAIVVNPSVPPHPDRHIMIESPDDDTI